MAPNPIAPATHSQAAGQFKAGASRLKIPETIFLLLKKYKFMPKKKIPNPY